MQGDTLSDWPNEASPFIDEIAACVAVIGRDKASNLIVTACNTPFLQMMGVAGADTPDFPIPIDALPGPSALRPLREKLLACFASDKTQESTYDFRDAQKWWRFSFKPISRASNSGVHQVLMTGFDVAAKRDLARHLDGNASRYRALVDLAYDAIVTMDERHNITLFNRAAENLFGYASAEVLGRPIVTLLPEKFRTHHREKVQRFAETYEPHLRQSTPPRMDPSNSVFGQHRDGTVIPVEIAVSKIELSGGTEFMAVVRDITDRARFVELLRKQAATDALTGLPNRRECLDFLKKMLAAHGGLSVFILDIDFFKEINDRHGHDVGDEVLRLLAKVGASTTEGTGLFARWGGEEFVAALPGANASLAHQIADELRLRFEQQDFEHVWRATPIPFTVSIGVVTRETGEVDVDALMKRADRALYRAKNSGRNRVETG